MIEPIANIYPCISLHTFYKEAVKRNITAILYLGFSFLGATWTIKCHSRVKIVFIVGYVYLRFPFVLSSIFESEKYDNIQ